MKTINDTTRNRYPRIDEARAFYGINAGQVETHYHVAPDGRIIYRHLLSGNDPQPTRVYDPATGSDSFHSNHGLFYYLTAIKRVQYRVVIGFKLGGELS